jgi:integrase
VVEVYRRAGSPYWYFDITVGGARRRRSTRRTRRSEALAVARVAATSELDRLQFPDMRQLTVREALFEHYLPTKANAASLLHLRRYCATICGDRQGAASIGGQVKLHELTNAMLRRYQTQRLAQGMSQQSVDHELKVLSAACNLVRSDYLVRPGLRFPISRPKGRPRYLTPAEEAALLAELDPSCIRGRGGCIAKLEQSSKVARQRADNYDLVVMLLDTGCRYGEIASLTWSMVDTARWQWLHIFREKVENEGRLATTERSRELLKKRWHSRDRSQLVFPGWSRRRDAPRSTTAAIRRAMERIGINSPANVARFGRRDVRSLRDTFATKLRTRGLALDQLQKILGHASPSMTQKYAHLSMEDASVRAATLLDELHVPR